MARALLKPKKDETYEQFWSRFNESKKVRKAIPGERGRRVACDETWNKARG